MTTQTQTDIVNRLKRIEGQVRGLQRLVEERQECTEIVNQLAAARKALDRVGFLILSTKMHECFEKQKSGLGHDDERAMDEAMKLFLTLA